MQDRIHIGLHFSATSAVVVMVFAIQHLHHSSPGFILVECLVPIGVGVFGAFTSGVMLKAIDTAEWKRCFLAGGGIGVGGLIVSSLVIALVGSLIVSYELNQWLFVLSAAIYSVWWMFFLAGGIAGWLMLAADRRRIR